MGNIFISNLTLLYIVIHSSYVVFLLLSTEMVVNWVEEISPTELAVTNRSEPTEPPAAKKPKSVRSRYLLKQRDDSQAASSGKSVQAQLKRYVAYDHGEVCFNENGEVKEINPVSFWSDSQVRISMPGLALLADLVLSVPASSAPVERLFSHGGIIFRPHRRRLTDEHLSEMIFAKCNRLYQ